MNIQLNGPYCLLNSVNGPALELPKTRFRMSVSENPSSVSVVVFSSSISQYFRIQIRTKQKMEQLSRFLTRRRYSTQLFVSRLSSYTTDSELRALFSRFGVVTEARLVKDGKTQRPKGFGFVTFESDDDAHKALKSMDRRIVDGRLIFVEIAKT